MKLHIGETIKHLRKEREITQEEFAEVLGVSCQSVSRWENQQCYPDIELIPVIAAFFGISTDKLLGLDETAEREAVERYLGAFQSQISMGHLDECIAIARRGVAEFPNNFVLLNKLMFALFASGDDDGNIPDWKENMEKYDAEITALGERIMKYCPDVNIKLEAAARLSFHHILHGRKELGRQICETFPPMELCREKQIWWALEREEILPFLHKAIKDSYELLKSFIWSLADADVVDVATEKLAIAKLFELEQLILDGNRPQTDWGDVWLAFDFAKRCALLGDLENTFRYLHIAVANAKAFDTRPEVLQYSAALVGEITIRKTDFETSDTRPLTEILRDKWLLHDEFDSVRDTDEFKAIIKELCV